MGLRRNSHSPIAVMAVLAWIFVWKLAPETKGRELEEIRHYWENGGSWTPDPDRRTDGQVRN